MRHALLNAGLAAALLTLPLLSASAERAPLSWEALDYNRPIYLTPRALVCRTIQQSEAAGLRDDEKGPGCMKAPDGSRIQVTWIGRGDGEYMRYQRVRGRMRGQAFEGWALGLDLTND